MSTRRRLALFAVLPVAFIVYACSSDSTDGGTTPGEEEGGTTLEGGPNPDIDSSTPGVDSSVNNPDTSMPDAADGSVSSACVGNPLTADGGTTDGGVNLDAAVVKQIVTVGAGNFLDGPQWIDAQGGFLVYSEYEPTSRLHRVAADGGANAPLRPAFPANTGPVGNAVRNGLIISAVDAKTGGAVPNLAITAFDGGAVTTIPLAAGATSPNDIVIGPGTNAYFTDGQYQNTGNVGTAGVYRLFGDGGITSIQQNFGRANGIALSPDNTKLYVGIGALGGDADPKAILVYNVAANGNVTAPGTSFLAAADLADTPDGLAVDVAGNLWVAEAAAGGAGGGRVEVFSPLKKKLGTIPFPAPHRPTGVAFGGADNKTLFVTTELGVWTYASRCAGVR
jgi:gluconolactonase